MVSNNFDVAVIGGGPGGYIAAIRASQLGKKVILIEKEHLGGVCLNKGCIPTKAVLKSAHMVHEFKDLKELGIDAKLEGLSGARAVQRAKKISDRISKGVGLLMKKNKIQVLFGNAKFTSKNTLEVSTSSGNERIEAKNIIISTGANYKTFPGLEHNGSTKIGAWEAIKLEELPEKAIIVGAGAIGVEFAYFWNAFGVDVHIIELQDRLLPLEDKESSLEVQKAYKKYGIKMSLGVNSVKIDEDGKGVIARVENNDNTETFKADLALIAVGMKGNIDGLDLDKCGVKVDARGFISVNQFNQTSQDNIYAIGDVSGPPLLAHVASHEGIIASEHLCGKNPHPIVLENVPACTYCQPQVASVGKTEEELKSAGVEYKVGKLPFIANGKAVASNEKDGHVKVLLGKYDELLGAHIVGTHATELIHEYTLFKNMEGIDEDIINTIHPHPTLGEWLAEAVMAAKGRALNF